MSATINESLDLRDPTTLAISLIPLLPSTLKKPLASNENAASASSLTLPILAASLSTLPPSVINAIHLLGQEVKFLREEKLLADSSYSRDNRLTGRAGASLTQDQAGANREEREKWLETQKVNHLKKSISSLTSLHSSLQSRHLTTVDTLSNLQQIHDRERQQLTDERDGVRAVNKVLKRKICSLEKKLDASKEVMEGVLEKVEMVNGGDWSIVDHGRIRVHSPLVANPHTSHHHGSEHEALEISGSFDQRNHSPAPTTNLDLPTNIYQSYSHPDLDPKQGPGHLYGSASSGPNNQRSLTLIVELTEEIECLREEAKAEIRSKDDEIGVMKRLVSARDDEIKILMGRLEHFMGLNGFYIPMGLNAIGNETNSVNQPTTPKALSSKGKGRANPTSDPGDGTLNHEHQLAAHRSRVSSHHRQLEQQIRKLESQLRDLTFDTNSLSGSSISGSSSSRCPRGAELDDCHPTFEEFASFASPDSCENQALSRALADLSNQVLDLKYALKEVSNERDTLRRLRRNRGDDGGGEASRHAAEHVGPENCRSLTKDLDDLQVERDRLNDLLMRAENRNFELQNRLVEQEAEFEKVAERVQIKLEEQRAKLYEAKHEIEELQTQLEQTKVLEQRGRQELDNERKRIQVLMGLIGNQKHSTRRRDVSPAQSSSQTSSGRRPRLERPVPNRPLSRVEALDLPTAETS